MTSSKYIFEENISGDDIMQHEHCTYCGFMSLVKMPIDGMKKCPRCNWEGYPDRSSMEEINKLAKGYRPGTKWAPPIKADALNMAETEDAHEPEQTTLEENREPVQKNLDPRKNSFRMDDATANRSENLIDPNRKVSNKVPGNQELLDRLKGKNIRGADFL